MIGLDAEGDGKPVKAFKEEGDVLRLAVELWMD